MKPSITRGKLALIEELVAALERLASGNTQVAKPPYRISQKTVCEEAGRHRSSIKNTPEFSQLRTLIRTHAKLRNERQQLSQVQKSRISNLNKKARALGSKLSEAEAALDSAVAMIHDLNVAILNIDEDYRELVDALDNVRSTNSSVDKALQLAGVDTLYRSTRR